jgi:hypothetical protein
MRRRYRAVLALAAVAVVGAAQQPWMTKFDIAPGDFATTGRNPYFILEPGYKLMLQHGGDSLLITVLDETKRIDNTDTRIVEEREWADGALVEVSRNYFAMNRKTQDTYYFGEDVDIYEHGKMVRHEGTWHSGDHGARYGLMIPARPRIGQRYYQEQAPGVALDRAEVVHTNVAMKTPAGRFTTVLETRESSALEKGSEAKFYAPGVGLIREEEMLLTRYGK